MPSVMRRTAVVRRGHTQRVDVTAHTLGRMRDAPLFLILDFRQVPRLDSTAAGRLANLKKLLDALGVQVLVCGLSGRWDSQVRQLLHSNGLRLVRYTPQEEDKEGKAEEEEHHELPALEFPSKDVASRYCEAQLLTYAASLSLVDLPQAVVKLPDLLAMHFSDPLAPTAGPVLAHANAWGSKDLFPNLKLSDLAAVLEKYLRPADITRGHVLFEQGHVLDNLYLIESGKLHLYAASREEVEAASARVHLHGGSSRHGSHSHLNQLAGCGTKCGKSEGAAMALASTLEYGPGCFVCPQDFCLNQATAFTARCFSPSARVMALHLSDYAALKRELPDAFIALQVALTRSISLELSSTMCQVLAN